MGNIQRSILVHSHCPLTGRQKEKDHNLFKEKKTGAQREYAIYLRTHSRQ